MDHNRIIVHHFMFVSCMDSNRIIVYIILCFISCMDDNRIMVHHFMVFLVWMTIEL